MGQEEGDEMISEHKLEELLERLVIAVERIADAHSDLTEAFAEGFNENGRFKTTVDGYVGTYQD